MGKPYLKYKVYDLELNIIYYNKTLDDIAEKFGINRNTLKKHTRLTQRRATHGKYFVLKVGESIKFSSKKATGLEINVDVE